MVGLLILAVALAGAAALCIFQARRSGQRADALGGTGTTSCQELGQLFRGVAGEVGAGSLKQTVELCGKATPLDGQPLTSPLASKPCVWYRSQVVEHYRVYEWKGEGKERKRELVDKTRTLSDEKSSSNLLLDDGTGTVEIDMRHAEIDRPIEILDRMREDEDDDWTSKVGLSISGGLKITVRGSAEGTVGYHHKEWAVPVGQQVFVMGEAAEEAGQLRVGKPGKGEFIVSTRTEKELATSAGRSSQGFAIAGVVLGVGALVSLIAALFA